MLLKTLSLLALAVAALWGTLFGWGWALVALPVSFLILAGLSVAFLWGVCQLIDLEQTPQEDSPFYRHLANVYAEALIQLFQAKVRTTGLENTPRGRRFLLVCNHLSSADPGIILHFFRDSQLAFLSKKENRQLFVVGRIMHRMLCLPIDRENDRAALKSILRAIDIVQQDKASIAVYPEGYTSRDGLLHPFRPGAFKIAQRAKVPIVVCTLRGTRHLIPNGLRLKKTEVELHLVRVIEPEEFAGMTTPAISDMVYETMIRDLGEEFRAK